MLLQFVIVVIVLVALMVGVVVAAKLLHAKMDDSKERWGGVKQWKANRMKKKRTGTVTTLDMRSYESKLTDRRITELSEMDELRELELEELREEEAIERELKLEGEFGEGERQQELWRGEKWNWREAVGKVAGVGMVLA